MCHELCPKSVGRMHDPSSTFTAAERNKHSVLRFMAAQHGGFKDETHIRREDRKDAVEALRKNVLKETQHETQTPLPRAAGAFVQAQPWDHIRKGHDKAELSDREAELGVLLKPDPPPGIPGWAWEIHASPNKEK